VTIKSKKHSYSENSVIKLRSILQMRSILFWIENNSIRFAILALFGTIYQKNLPRLSELKTTALY
jgi:hypothetical protein